MEIDDDVALGDEKMKDSSKSSTTDKKMKGTKLVLSVDIYFKFYLCMTKNYMTKAECIYIFKTA